MPITRSQDGDNRPVTRQRREQVSKEKTPAEELRATSSGTINDSIFTSGTSYSTTDSKPVTEQTIVETLDQTASRPERPKSKATSVASVDKRKKELELRAEMERRHVEAARAAAALAKTQLELLTLEEDDVSDLSEPEDKNESVVQWVIDTVERMSGKGQRSTRPEEKPTMEDHHISPTTGGNMALADAILQAIKTTTKSNNVPSHLYELPIYDGNTSEWLAFKTVYDDTAANFSPVQNMARLRKAVKGAAREAVKSLLYSECQPEYVVEALRKRFGRPDALVLAEIEKLRSLPKMNEDLKDVCVFASQVNNIVATVKSLKKPQYLQSPEMLKTIVDKMPVVLRFRWFDYTTEKEDTDLVLLAKFLDREADRCGPYAMQEAVSKRQGGRRENTHTTLEKRKDNHTERERCPHCEEDHRLYQCKKFLGAPSKQRWEIAQKSKLCFKCLQGRHRKENCKKAACKFCKKWHHDLLHEDQHHATASMADKKEVSNNMLQVNATNTHKAYLKMVPVQIYGPKGSTIILALLDEGSTVTLIDSSIAEQLGLQGPKEPLTIETVGGRLLTKIDSMRLQMKIRGVYQDKNRSLNAARTIDELRLAPQVIDKKVIEEYPHLNKLADKLCYEKDQPKLLIGQDNWELIISRSTRKGKKNQPVASLTYLGWVLHGCGSGATNQVNFVTCAHVSAREEELENMIKEHFAIESMGVLPRRPSTDAEGRAIEILEKTSRRLDNGRFEVGLLWKKENEEMPDNYKSAENRLRGIEKKLDKDDDFKEEYGKQIQHLLDSGYAEVAPQNSTSNRKWYLPHFAVTHPTKHKKRLVFDAAAKFAGKCLNDMLLPGPDLLQSLFGVLLRFRQHPVAVVADIKEMFLQIKIREQDRDSLRFLWRGDQRTGRPQEYRMTSVIFGAACSPSTAIYIKNRNAAEFKMKYPEAVQAIEKNHYMDDYLHSLMTEEEAIKIASEVDTIHQKAGFQLRGWASNRLSVLRKLTREDEQKEIELGSKEEKTLGLRWFSKDDKIGFRTTLRNVQEVIKQDIIPTKREVTSAVMSTFDPMGLVSPVLIQGKKLLQNIWRSGVGWDDEVPVEIVIQWKKYLESLQLLKDLRIPRCIRRSSHEGELHVFTDASETAYACAAYWRQENEYGLYDVMLLAGKARVTPLKPVSIPRLELQAALLGTRMACSIEEELDVKLKRKVYWTDSSTVLGWIKTDPRSFKPFVAHRLAEIEDYSNPQEWRWVSTKDNPADDATRGIPKEFSTNHRWFTGPPFLKEHEDFWPTPRSFKTQKTGEEKDTFLVANTKISDKYPTPDPSRFSSWNRLLRATARVIQFVNLCKPTHKVNVSKETKKHDPTWKKSSKKSKENYKKVVVQEERKFLPIEENYKEIAEEILLRRSQEESFGEEITALSKGKALERSSKLKKIDVALDENLIRLRGRIDAAHGLESNFKRPLVLDSKNHITRLLIAHYHRVFNHGNHATVINEIRQRFWVLGLRAAVRATAHQCQWCRVYKSQPQQIPMGDLPEERLHYGEQAFTCSAVDYFGPMIITIGRRHEKRWGALFTCLTTRAVHVEIASSLSSSSMILALRRMAARRGMPKCIFSDNGTNFVGANKELKEALENLKKEELISETEKIGVKWKYIAPGAPNMGGAWERLVRSIKTALAKTLKDKYPKEEVLHTLILEAEHIVNSRPLVEKIDDDDKEALTPNHFLIGRSCGLPRIGVFGDNDLKGRHDWRMTQRLVDHFWSRWLKEYLPTLIPRKIKGKVSCRDLRCGNVVLVVDSTLPRGTWPRGEVVHTYPGPDGRTRVIEVRTNGGILRRPSSKAVLLVPVQDDAPSIEAATSPSQKMVLAHEGEDVGDGQVYVCVNEH